MSAYLPYTARLRTILVSADSAGLALAVYLAYHLRFDPLWRGQKWGELLASPGLLLWALASGLALAAAAELYEPEVLHRRREVAVRVAVMIGGWSTALVLATYLSASWAYGRGVLALTAAIWSLLMITSRWAMTAWLRRRRRFSALVVGDPEAVGRFCRELEARPSAPWAPLDGSAIALHDIPAAIERQGASIVVLAGSDEHALEMGHDLAELHFSGVPVVAASEVWAWLEERLPLEALSPALFLHQPGFGAVHWTLFNRLTRIADIVLAAVMLVLSAPLFFAAALLVWLADGFPVLYRQDRVGQFGRHFTMLKLRTMEKDAERHGPVFSAEKDPRTLAVGRLLRRFRLDELPQLLNVMKGEMSLVGPRPERPEFVARLTDEIPYYAFRTAVPPGITGWAQVNVPYASDLVDHRRKLEYDLYFIRERSTRLYLLTLLRTVSASLVGVRSSVAQAPAGSAETAAKASRPTPESRDRAPAFLPPTKEATSPSSRS
jgi:exopolysaccharide biosynthesis polyprenyl glycosylphosphotransferase